jgi:hypothetical protein
MTWVRGSYGGLHSSLKTATDPTPTLSGPTAGRPAGGRATHGKASALTTGFPACGVGLRYMLLPGESQPER